MLLIEVWRRLTVEERQVLMEERKRAREKCQETIAALHKQIDGILADATDARELHRAELVQRGNDYLEVCARHGRTMQALSRANAENVQLVRALRALVEVWNVKDPSGDWGPPSDVLNKALKEAKEVLALVGIPF